MKNNQGTAIILSLVIVSVLFILTSFLVRKVVTNTTMVEKAGEEQESYALAKQGILYAIDQLNTGEGYSTNYDPTDWPGDTDWHDYNLDNRTDTGDTSGNDVTLKVEKNTPSGYITIESQDLPKKLVTLQAITKNTSPLLNYLRFINSDAVTVFEDNTFGPTGSESLIQGDAPFCIIGDVTWESGSTNNLILSDSESKAIIYGTISNGGVTSLEINGPPQSGYYYFFDPDDASYDDPADFDTADGHYFSSAHLPSCYDYSGGTPTFYDGSTQATFWPEIKKDRYQNLASGTNCYLDNDTEINKKSEWTDPNRDNNLDYDNDIEDEWFQDTASSTSFHYYPYAARLVFNNIDTGGDTGPDLTQYLSIGTLNTIDYSDITNSVILAEGDISISGIIPAGIQLTIVSGGNIFIDSNLLKETNTASLALLAKQNIVLNPTIRYAVAWASPYDSWQNNPGAALGNPGDGNSTYPGTGIISIPPDTTLTYTLDLDLGKLVTGGRIVLWGYEDGEGSQIDTTLDVLLSRDAASWDTAIIDENPSEDYHIDFTPQTFRWIRLELHVTNGNSDPQDFNLGSEGFDAIEIPIYAVDAALFAEEGSLKVVTGGGVFQVEDILPNNNAYEPDAGGPKTPGDSGSFDRRLFFWGTLAEEEWTGSISGWNYIAYVYDSNLSDPSNSPPSLPPSVNLVSLKRK